MINLWRRTTLGLLVAVPLIALVLLRTDLNDTVDALEEANYALIPPATILFALAMWLQALRWRLLLKPLSDVSAYRLYPVLLIGHLGNALLPLRGGEIVRAAVLKQREGVSGMATLGTLAVERALDGLTLVGLLAICLAFVETSQRLWGLALVGGVIFGIATAALAAVAFWPEGSSRLVEIVISRAPQKWRNRMRRWLDSFFTGTRALRTPSGVAAVLIVTVGFWVLVAVVYQIVGEAFHLHQGFGTYLLVTAAANLSVSVPSSQGGFGPFEFFVRQTLVFAGVTTPVATAYALALHIVLLLPMICLGLVSLWIVGLSFTQITQSTDVDEPAAPSEEIGLTSGASKLPRTSVSQSMPEEAGGVDRP